MKKAIALLLALVTLLSLTACAGKEDTASSALDQIKQKGELVVGTSADYPPYEFHTEVDGKDTIVGFDMEIAQAIADKLGLAFQIRDDMLDVIGNADEFGKPIGSDKDEGKVTYVDLLGLDDCGKLVHELTEQAVSTVSDLDQDGFLTALAESLTERTK